MSLPRPGHWLAGLALSLGVAWGAGALLLDTVQPMQFDATVGRYVAVPGTSRTRGEGWASSTVGEHGLRGFPDGKIPPGPKVVFWGDSFVEALQVDDRERMAQVFTRLSADAALGLTGVGIGTGGDSLIDSYFKLPDYAPVLGPLALNVFFLGKLGDVLPDAARPCRATFSSAPWRLAPGYCPPSALALRYAPLLRELELASAFEVWARLRGLKLRLGPGPEQALPGPAYPDQSLQDAAVLNAGWDYLLARLREQARGQIVLVYAPTLLRLEQGRLRLDDVSGGVAGLFAQVCQRSGVAFLDLGPGFAAHYQATGRFPRGFFNSPPGTGHLNEDGHRLVAQAVCQYIVEHHDALLAR